MQKTRKFSLSKAFVYLASFITLSMVAFLILYILINGIPNIIAEISKLTQGLPSIFDLKYNSDNVSLIPALINTFILTLISILIASILGIFTAIFLVEFAKKGSKMVTIIGLTAETLSGIPSIIYGLFGSIFFVTFLGLGLSLLSGILTISIMILPLIIRSTEEALKSVPENYREASFGLGASKLRTTFKIVLPSAANGILAGIILAIGRVIGETAALLYTAGTSPNATGNLLETGRTLSVHMYMLSSEGLYINQTYATAAVLLIMVLTINIFSTFIAKKLVKG